MGLSGLGWFGLECGSDVPGQQFLDAIDRMVGDRRQDRAQVECRIEAIQFGGSDEAVERCSSMAAGVGTHKEVVFPADRDGTQCPFRGVVVDLQLSVVQVARECAPVRERIADGARRLALG